MIFSIDKRTVCHIGKGGGQRSDFAEAFECAGYRIARKKFPELFAGGPQARKSVNRPVSPLTH
jgi:hypothetical protein